MRILFFCERKPHSLCYGDTLRIYNISKSLTKRKNKVFLIHFSSRGNPQYLNKNLMDNVVEETFSLDFPNFYDNIYGKIYKILLSAPLSNFISFKPVSIRNIQNKLKNIIETYKIDLIHVQGPIAGLSMINFHEKPKLLDLTDSLSLSFKRELSPELFSNRRLQKHLLYNWSKGIEKTLLMDSDIATVVSSVDKQMLKDSYDKTRIEVIPNGIDGNFFSPKNNIRESYPSILFHGNMDFSPNIHSVKYIAEQILPLIKSKIPNVKFFVVGGNPTDEIKRLGENKNIIVTGYVKDIREYISKASVGLYPMKSGSGIKNKILESMAMGKSVVSNLMGVEALSEKAKKCILIGETPEELANHVLKLLKNEDIRTNLGKKSREVIIKEYSWENVAEKYEKLYEKLLNKF